MRRRSGNDKIAKGFAFAAAALLCAAVARGGIDESACGGPVFFEGPSSGILNALKNLLPDSSPVRLARISKGAMGKCLRTSFPGDRRYRKRDPYGPGRFVSPNADWKRRLGKTIQTSIWIDRGRFSRRHFFGAHLPQIFKERIYACIPALAAEMQLWALPVCAWRVSAGIVAGTERPVIKKGRRAAIFPAGEVCAIFFVHSPRNTGISCFIWRSAGLFGFPALAVAL